MRTQPDTAASCHRTKLLRFAETICLQLRSDVGPTEGGTDRGKHVTITVLPHRILMNHRRTVDRLADLAWVQVDKGRNGVPFTLKRPCEGLSHRSCATHYHVSAGDPLLQEQSLAAPKCAFVISSVGTRKPGWRFPPLQQFFGHLAEFMAPLLQVLFETEDHLEGAKALVEKREPVYKGK